MDFGSFGVFPSHSPYALGLDPPFSLMHIFPVCLHLERLIHDIIHICSSGQWKGTQGDTNFPLYSYV